jgi:uncharacterized protein DUF6982
VLVFPKKRMGKLTVRVDYSTHVNFSMTLTIRELKLMEPITFEGKTFDVPVGTYTLALKGLMHDPCYGGSYHAVYKGVYGWFERRQRVDVQPDQDSLCTFVLPKDELLVRVRVFSAGAPVVGAEVLIRDTDPNFRPTRPKEGAVFFLVPGTYGVVVSHGNVLMKEVIHVSQQATEFVMDISRQMALRPSLVVVRYWDGRLVKGVTGAFAPGVSRFTVRQEDGEEVLIEGFAGVKAIFFVRSLDGDRFYDEQKDFALASQFGRKTVVVFSDREEIWGYTLPGHTNHPHFFLFPADPLSNNAKVYVVRDGVAEIRFG